MNKKTQKMNPALIDYFFYKKVNLCQSPELLHLIVSVSLTVTFIVHNGV